MTVSSKWIRFGAEDACSGYLALPASMSAERRPAVIVIQEIWGVDAHIRDVAERFAAEGFLALAPDLFFQRGAKPPALEDARVQEAKRFLDTLPPTAWRDAEARSAKLAELPADRQEPVGETLGAVFSAGAQTPAYLATLEAASQWLRGQGGRAERVAAVGFCLGGKLSAQLAVRDAALAGAVVFYGDLPEADQAPSIQCPVLGVFGALDKRITDQVPAFAEAMQASGKSLDYRIYDDAPHAFFNDTRASYREAAAKDAFARTVAFLNEQLK